MPFCRAAVPSQEDRTVTEQTPKRRLGRATGPVVEQLEGRRLLSGGTILAAVEAELRPRAADEWLEESLTTGTTTTAARPSPPRAASTAHQGATPAATPSVTSVSPATGATGVLRDASIRLTVDLPNAAGIDSDTLLDGIRIFETDNPANRVNSIRNTSGGGDVIVITPRSILAADRGYTVQITGGLKDTTGAGFAPFTTTFTTGSRTSQTPTTVAFEKLPQAGTAGKEWTAVTFGPDGMLYAATRRGQIVRYGTNPDGSLNGGQAINTVTDNHGGAQRIVTGLEFAPGATASNLVLYASHGQGVLEDADNWTGKISKLSGPNLATYQDVVTGLPRSVRDHLNNQMRFGPDGALYVIQGSMSAAGAADPVWGNRSETELSGAVLRVDVDDIGSGTVNARTGDGGSYNPYAADAPVTLYATGIRNAYDMVWHRNGKLYVPTNGTAAGGESPAGDGAPALDDVPSQPDYLVNVVEGGYYGHPNPERGEYVLYGGNPTGDADKDEVGVYPVGTEPDNNYRGSAYTFGLNYSPNGVIEYRGGEFGNTLDGKLMVVRYSAGDDIVILGVNRDGAVTSAEIGAPGLTQFNDPLDLVQDPRSGFIYVAEFGGQQLTLLKADPTLVSNKPQLTFSDPAGGDPSPRQKITFTNRSGAPLTIPRGGLRLVGVHSDEFAIFDPPASAVTLAPGQSMDVRLTMNARTGQGGGFRRAILRVATTDASVPPFEIPVRGLVLTGTGGDSEPSLQRLMDLHGIGVRVGDSDPDSTALNLTSPNDEIDAAQFYKAKPGIVSLEPIAVFTQDGSPTVKAGWYTPGNAKARNPVGTVDPVYNQSAQPLFAERGRFDPGSSAFGIFSQFPGVAGGRIAFSEGSLNTWEPTGSRRDKVKVYPLRTANGSVVKYAYVVAVEEETGAGGDFNDAVFVLRNVQLTPPAGSDPDPEPTTLRVTGFRLLDAADDVNLGVFDNHATIDRSELPSFSMLATVAGTPGSVQFRIDGQVVRTENFSPWTIAGENGTDQSDFLPLDVPNGTHTLLATPFSGANATGTAGTPLGMTFSVVA